jgi:hypothetical protein
MSSRMRVTESDIFDRMTPSKSTGTICFFRKAAQGHARLLKRAIFILDADAVSRCQGSVTGAAPILVCDYRPSMYFSVVVASC